MGENNISIWEEIKQIDLVSYLDSIGHQPKLIRNSDYWYYSPFRQEKTPSFKVNRQRNVWFDHGTGEGGTIIELGVKLFNCSYHELIEKLTNVQPFLNKGSDTPSVKVNSVKSKIEILSVIPLDNSELRSYLKSRAIDLDLARQHCSEIDFKINERTYKAIGFPNRSGGYELRNNWFKGSSSPKDISLITSVNQSPALSVFEGFIDFLSALKVTDFKFKEIINNSSFLVLNSLALLGREIPLIRSFPNINLFLDNDKAGKEARAKLERDGIHFQDASSLYSKHKDVNEYLMSSTSVKQQEFLHRKPRNKLSR